MGDDLAAANVNRSYSLAASSIAIFTFLLLFLYPRFASSEINTLLFLATTLVLFSIGLIAVGAVWFTLWPVYSLFVIRYFSRIETARKNS